jgi:peptidoglycan/LPS O-acetylase OafA/YrhL
MVVTSPVLPVVPRPIHFPGLNALRFAAALAIILYHTTLGFQQGHLGLAASWHPSSALALHNLSLGVDLFFIISGFLIVYLLLAEKAAAHTISLRKFYARRALRIFPLYFLIVAVAYVQYHTTHPEIDFSKFIYFWGNFWLISRGAWTVPPLTPLWSLCIEEQFYLVIPLLLLWLPLRRVPFLFGGVVVLTIAFRAYAAASGPANWMLLYCHTLSRCDLLALGGLLAYWHFTHPLELQLPDWFFWALTAAFALLLSLVATNNFTAVVSAALLKYVFALPLVAIFCFLVFNSSPLTQRINQSRVLDYMGKISYGLYMYYGLIIEYLGQHPILPPAWHRALPILVLGLTAVVAAVSYELFEKQLLKLKSRFEALPTQLAMP